ncbi:MAG TPA: tetratricopeptide repeat protein [Candidatus Sulfotelmatobacter sp.]|nr:tetratricopeptide repeat protein [Candidatus Sulfotelmatobacter sp.]
MKSRALQTVCLGVWLCLCAVSLRAQQTATPDLPSAPMPESSSQFVAAKKLMQQGEIDEAITQLRTLESTSPGTKGLALELGTAYYKKSDYPNAIEYLKKAVAENPASEEATQLLGMSYFASGHPADAIPLLEKVQASSPHANADGYYILGTCYIQIENYDGARKAFGTMFGVPGDSAAAYLFTARMLLRQEFDPVAEQYAEKAVALDPKLPMGHYLLGELDLYRSKLPEAIGEFQKELEINPAHAPTYYKLGDAYLRAQKYDEAQSMLQRSIRLDSTSSVPFILMGKVLQKKGDYDLAVLSLKHAVTMEPNNPTSHYLLGQVYREMGRKEDAAAELKRAQELHGDEDLD